MVRLPVMDEFEKVPMEVITRIAAMPLLARTVLLSKAVTSELSRMRIPPLSLLTIDELVSVVTVDVPEISTPTVLLSNPLSSIVST